MQARRLKRKNAFRALLWAWGILLSCVLVFLSARNNRVVAAAEGETVDIFTPEQFAAYSAGYADGAHHPQDVLNISIQAGSTVTDRNFISLGTAERPFAGTLNIPTSGIDVFNLFECPLFDYVTTDLKITGGGTVKITRDAIVETPPVGALTSGALFANHVVAGEDAANWTISFEGGSAPSYEGLIGTIADECDVTVSFSNSTNIPIVGTDDVGYIAGLLGEDATLSVTTSGTGSNLSVSTTDGHAGGIVGRMKEDAILELKSANNTRVNSVTTSDANGYAGGIVGYVDHVSASTGIILNGVVDYAVSGSVTGGAGAGGLFGYYRSYVNGAAFNLNQTYQIASGMRVSSSGNTGGVFGYLVNQGTAFTFDGNAPGSETLTVTLSSGSARGGIAGKYETARLTDVLTITDTKVVLTANAVAAGGLIGQITSNPAYVAITEVDVTSAGTSAGNAPGGGLIVAWEKLAERRSRRACSASRERPTFRRTISTTSATTGRRVRSSGRAVAL